MRGPGRAAGNAADKVLTDRDFARFQQLIYREAGIHLSPAKKALLVRRLNRRIQELGLDSFAAYYRRVEADVEDERVRMLDLVSTNETQFFREPRQFQLLEDEIVPAWRAAGEERRRERRVRAWSAACSTGEEPFSLAMTLLAGLPGWQVEVLATDLSTRVLEQARSAVWPLSRAEKIPRSYLERFMLRGTRSQEGKMKAVPELRSVVRFERLNLHTGPYPRRRFDLVLCRNVLIYFDVAARTRVIGRLLDHLAPGGYLFLGHAENLSGLTDRMRGVIPSVYTWIAPAGVAPAGVAPLAVTPAGAAADRTGRSGGDETPGAAAVPPPRRPAG